MSGTTEEKAPRRFTLKRFIFLAIVAAILAIGVKFVFFPSHAIARAEIATKATKALEGIFRADPETLEKYLARTDRASSFLLTPESAEQALGANISVSTDADDVDIKPRTAKVRSTVQTKHGPMLVELDFRYAGIGHAEWQLNQFDLPIVHPTIEMSSTPSSTSATTGSAGSAGATAPTLAPVPQVFGAYGLTTPEPQVDTRKRKPPTSFYLWPGTTTVTASVPAPYTLTTDAHTLDFGLGIGPSHPSTLEARFTAGLANG